MVEILDTLFFEKFFVKKDSKAMKVSWHTLQKNDTLYNSIISNIFNILNTTSSIKADEYLRTKLTVMEYGIPDLSPYISPYYIDTSMVSKCITHALLHFEKRVENIKVEVKDEGIQKTICLMGCVKGLENVSEMLAYKVLGGRV